jgi:hypothetical protein
MHIFNCQILSSRGTFEVLTYVNAVLVALSPLHRIPHLLHIQLIYLSNADQHVAYIVPPIFSSTSSAMFAGIQTFIKPADRQINLEANS